MDVGLRSPSGQSWCYENVVRDITPDSPGPMFNLPDQPSWRCGIEPWINGKRFTYRLDAHFDKPVYAKGSDEIAEFRRGKSRELRFESSARSWEEFRRDFFFAVREYIRIQAKLSTVRRMRGRARGR